MLNIRDFGATGDGITDDRAAIQAALDAAAAHLEELFVPTGRYLVSQVPGAYYALRPPAPVRIRGQSHDDSVLLLAAGAGPSCQLFWLEGLSGVSIRSIALDGQRDLQPDLNPQRHGIFAKRCTDLVLDDIIARNFTGDGAHVHDNSSRIMIRNSVFADNARNGFTLGGYTDDVTFVGCQLKRCRAQQLDMEHGPQNNITIVGCLIDPDGQSDDFALTITGGSSELRSDSIVAMNNIINGSTLIEWSTNVAFLHNSVANPSSKPAVYIYRSVDGVLVHGNTLASTGAPAFDAGAIVHVMGTNPGQSPGGVVISDNQISSIQPSYGISAICVRGIRISDNSITGTQGPKRESGIFVRTTRELEPVRHVLIERNSISGFAGYGVRLGGNGTAPVIAHVEISGNSFRDGMAAMYLNDGYDEAHDVTVCDNACSADLPSIVNPPGGVAAPWGDGTRWRM